MFGLDVLLVALVAASLPVCVWRPWLGVLVFTWLGCMYPHRLVGGLAYDLPLSKLVAAATLIGLLFTTQRYRLPRRREVYLLGALWLTLLASTTLTALEPERAWSKFAEVSKVLLMTGVTMVLFQDRAKVRALLLVMALSIGLLGIGGASWGFATGLEQRLFGPPGSSIADNNALGFAFTIVLPLLAYLRQEGFGAPTRALLLVAFALSIVALFATYSRGAFVGACLVLALIAMQIRSRDLALLGAGLAACAVLYFAPQQWLERMETITPTAYRVDSSGAERMKAWYVAYRLGVDHWLLGGGFHPFSPAVYERYLPGYSDAHDAHNHFLQVFAEHGLTGLVLFVALMASVLLRLWGLARTTPDDPQREWIGRCAPMIGIAVIGFAAGGAFINMPYLDLYLELVAVTVVLQELAAWPGGNARAALDERGIVAVMRRARGRPQPGDGRQETGVPVGSRGPGAVRVLVLSTVFPNAHRPTYGVFVRERVRHVAARCDVQVIAPIRWFPLQQWVPGRQHARPPAVEEQCGFPVYHPCVFSIPGIGKSLDGLFFFLSLLPFIARLRRDFPFAVIDAHFAYPDGLGAVLLGWALRCPVAITLRGYEIELTGHALRRPQLRFALRRAHVIAVSESLRRLAGDLGVPRERVRVIPNAVDARRFHPSDQRAARARLGLPLDRTILLSVGTFVEDKGHERVLDVLERIAARRPDLYYVAVGNSGGRDSRVAAVRERVRAQGLGDRVRLEVARPHEEMPAWMAAADLFCLATRREGCCNAVAEALACGVPVVTTRVGGNPEFVHDGADGFLVPFFDAAAFADAIARGLEHGWDRAAIAQRATARGWDDAAAAVVEELHLACRARR